MGRAVRTGLSSLRVKMRNQDGSRPRLKMAVASLAVLGLAVSLAACGGAQASSKGAVTGYVEVFNPVAGMHRVTYPTELTATQDGRRVATTYATRNGTFRLKLSPGAYAIVLTAVYGYEGGKEGWVRPSWPAVEHVEVRSGRVTKVVLASHPPRGQSALGAA